MNLPFFVTADTHFLHPAIGGFCNRPENHQELIVQRWNETVGPDDVIIHLGDLVLGKRKAAEAFFESAQLNGRKFLVLGNHDKRSKSFYAGIGFEVIDPFVLDYEGWKVYFTHYPLVPPVHTLAGDEINTHGHVHNLYVDNLSVRHTNVGVDMRHLTPQDAEWHIKNSIRRLSREDRTRDWQRGGKDFEPPED